MLRVAGASERAAGRRRAGAPAEVAGASGRALLDAYVVGFEIEGRLGRAMNPRHYQRGWHCTSTLGTIGAAAAASRLLGLDAAAAGHALAIAASEASGLKENFGTMVKPLHAGLAARNGVLAALLAQAGMTASSAAIDGPQGFLAAMDSEQPSLDAVAADLGDALGDRRHRHHREAVSVVRRHASDARRAARSAAARRLPRATRSRPIEIGVDPIVPTILLYDRPSSGLEGKFSMPFCAAAAIVHGRVGIDTFERRSSADPAILAMQARVTMRVDPTLDAVGAVAHAGARDRPAARRPRADGVGQRRARLPGTAGERRRAGDEVHVVRDADAVRRRRLPQRWPRCATSNRFRTSGADRVAGLARRRLKA